MLILVRRIYQLGCMDSFHLSAAQPNKVIDICTLNIFAKDSAILGILSVLAYFVESSNVEV